MIDDSRTPSATRARPHQALGPMPPSRRVTEVRSAISCLTVWGGGPIALSLVSALRLSRRWASASA